MKKIFLLAALFGTLHCSLAQTAKTSKLRWGVKTGLNASKTTNGFGVLVTPENFKDPSYKLGVFGGFFIQIPLTEMLILQPEISYSQEGSLQNAKTANTNNEFVLYFRNKLNYLNIPILLQYNLSKGFYVEAGPQLGILLQSTQIKVPTSESSDQKSSTQSTNLSLAAGLGYQFKNGFGVSARYVAGLSNIHKVAPEMKISTIQIGTHYRFAK